MVAVKRFSERYMVKKIIETRAKHDESREVLIKFELRVRGKVPFLISLKN